MRGREKFKKVKPLINIIVGIIKIIPMKIRIRNFLKLRYSKGYVGLLRRYIYLKSIAPKCGDNVSVHENVYLLNPHKFECGHNVSIHPMCYIDAAGYVEIGNDVSVAHGVTIMSSTHNYENETINIKDQGLTLKKTKIDNNVWIGAKATILAGVTVQSGCIIGAGSVVTKDCESNGIYAGVPAKKIKTRDVNK